jgi:hypothetical protein
MMGTKPGRRNLTCRKNSMKNELPDVSPNGRVEREVERERRERMMNDEARSGLTPSDDYRTKDARESMNSSNLKRSLAR